MALNRREDAEQNIISLEMAYEDFEKAHDKYHAGLTEDNELDQSAEYRRKSPATTQTPCCSYANGWTAKQRKQRHDIRNQVSRCRA